MTDGEKIAALLKENELLKTSRDELRAALEKIKASAKMTRLADCCVEGTCHVNSETNSCSFQTGVNYGNEDRAAEAKEAIQADDERWK